MGSESGHSDGSATSDPLGHHLLRHPRGDSARKIWNKTPTLYRHFIDDNLGIWLVDIDPSKDSRQWTSFVALMQDYYGLEWIFEERSKKVNYMYMKISIRDGWIVTSLYEKAMNLYLYIPPHSAQPPEVLTGLVSGNILRIHLLCSDQDDINLRMK